MKTIEPLPDGEKLRTEYSMDLYLFRHGYTRYNLERRYQGRTDLPLIPEESERIRPYSFESSQLLPDDRIHPRDDLSSDRIRSVEPLDVVYVSPALRARQTAALLFPGMEQIVIDQFREMDVGIFEGRSADEMESDPAYRSWVDSMCEDPVPGGESGIRFIERVTERFRELAVQAAKENRKRLLIVAHGGVQMAVMRRFCVEDRSYWSWQSEPAQAVAARLSLQFCPGSWQEPELHIRPKDGTV